VLVENFRTGTLDRWGLDLATLHARNPRLIVLRLTGFGQTGPYARRPGFARIFEAMSGFAHLTGEADGPPQHMNYPLGDAVAGLFGAFSIAAALAERNALPPGEQRGVEIDLSATEAMLRLLDPLAAEYQLGGQARGRTGSCAGYTAPSNVYRTRDGAWLTVVATGDTMFARLCQAMDRAELAADPRFADNAARIRHLQALDALIVQWCAALDCAQAMAALSAHDIPFSKVYSAADAMQDPHFAERGSFISLPDPDLGCLAAPAPVPRFTGRSAPAPRTGPATGQDNARIYAALGVDAQQQERLRREGVI
jgi:crotonobetainyl-CoA:carnitine CoA-transferase CaiB-like acyl-CoA transferase